MTYKLDIFLDMPYKRMYFTVLDQAFLNRCGYIILSPFSTNDFFISGSTFSESNPKVSNDLRKKPLLLFFWFYVQEQKRSVVSPSHPHDTVWMILLLCILLCFESQFSVSDCSHCRLSLYKTIWVSL